MIDALLYKILPFIIFSDVFHRIVTIFKKASGPLYFDLYLDRMSGRIRTYAKGQFLDSKFIGTTIADTLEHEQNKKNKLSRQTEDLSSELISERILTDIEEEDIKMGKAYSENKFSDKFIAFIISAICFI
ncbi:MAG: hypothetical protein CMF42_01345 [Legionellales bacterium]|nr:hypothetical protein [Legionellales bacterium]|tara:strand:- start:3074 stop:3463 length:390 start_codon:yes stop_codon:yes gene_type:complete